MFFSQGQAEGFMLSEREKQQPKLCSLQLLNEMKISLDIFQSPVWKICSLEIPAFFVRFVLFSFDVLLGYEKVFLLCCFFYYHFFKNKKTPNLFTS